MGRLEELRINAYLSEIARGYGNNSFIADKLIRQLIPKRKKKIYLNLTKRLFKYMIPKELSEQIQM